MKLKIRNWIKKIFQLYDITDLTINTHCGICGKSMPNTISEKGIEWSICINCLGIWVNSGGI